MTVRMFTQVSEGEEPAGLAVEHDSGPSDLPLGELASCVSCRRADAVIWADYGDERYPVCVGCAPTNLIIPDWVRADA